jgi:hypothetical protein
MADMLTVMQCVRVLQGCRFRKLDPAERPDLDGISNMAAARISYAGDHVVLVADGRVEIYTKSAEGGGLIGVLVQPEAE